MLFPGSETISIFLVSRTIALMLLYFQAAVNVSIIKGTLSAERAQSMSSRGRDIDQAGGQEYSAAALSLVFHPTHPYVPTLRADVRCFRVILWKISLSEKLEFADFNPFPSSVAQP